MSQVTGPISKASNFALDMMTHILIRGGDFSAAWSAGSRALAVFAQLGGLDCAEVLTSHGQLAAIYEELGYPLASIQHLLTAKYLMQLLGGPNHPEIINLLVKLASIYRKVECYDVAFRCLLDAKERSANGDQAKFGGICQSLAEICVVLEKYDEALLAQQQSLIIFKQLIGEEDVRFVESKACLEKIRRLKTEKAVKEARQKQIDEAAEYERQLTADWLDDSQATSNGDKSKSKKKHNKNKNSKKK